MASHRLQKQINKQETKQEEDEEEGEEAEEGEDPSGRKDPSGRPASKSDTPMGPLTGPGPGSDPIKKNE